MTMYVADMISRDDLINYYQELFEGKLEKAPAPVWDQLVDCCANIQADDLQDLIWDAFDSDLVWEGSISKLDVEEAFAVERQEALDKLKNDARHNLINDVIEEMSWWACFNEGNLDEDELVDQFLQNTSKLISEEEVEQFRKPQEQYYNDPFYNEPVRTEAKIGRNQPCPCGSGKKYKKCCGKPGGQS